MSLILDFTTEENIFTKFDQEEEKIPAKLLYQNYATAVPHPFCTVESFKIEYEKLFGRPPKEKLFSRLDYDPNHKYFASGVSYTKVEKYASKTTAFSRPKNDTYTLCPYCDPFQKAKATLHLGNELKDSDEPKFYNTLKTEYIHHLANVHGIKEDGTVMAQPFIGFSKSKVTATQNAGEYRLNCICPYSNKHNGNEPCLAEFRFEHKKSDGNPFKAYFRHAALYHIHESSKQIPFRYERVVFDSNGKPHDNIFIPLSLPKYDESLKTLQNVCGAKVEPINLCKDEKFCQKVENYVDKSSMIQQTATLDPIERQLVTPIQNHTGQTPVQELDYLSAYISPNPPAQNTSSQTELTYDQTLDQLNNFTQYENFGFAPDVYNQPQTSMVAAQNGSSSQMDELYQPLNSNISNIQTHDNNQVHSNNTPLQQPSLKRSFEDELYDALNFDLYPEEKAQKRQKVDNNELSFEETIDAYFASMPEPSMEMAPFTQPASVSRDSTETTSMPDPIMSTGETSESNTNLTTPTIPSNPSIDNPETFDPCLYFDTTGIFGDIVDGEGNFLGL